MDIVTQCNNLFECSRFENKNIKTINIKTISPERNTHMKNSNLKRSFNRSLAAVAVGACLATSPMTFAASNTTGSIHGQAAAGTVVTFKSSKTGLERQVTVDANGKFNFKNVPTGSYTVTSAAGKTRTVLVAIGTGSNVNFTQSDTEVIQVRGSAISTIDVSNVESGMVFTADELERLPVGRDITSVALLTPGVVSGDPGFGNLPSFGGSSVAENGFYIDGFDVTNIRTFLNFASVPFDAISQTQVKTGGYGAEYGRSLGGVTNIVTKSGSNEWEFGAAAYYTPNSLRASGQDVDDLGTDDGSLSRYVSDNERDTMSYNVSVSGPIVEDTLFFYLNLEGKNNTRDSYGLHTSTSREITSPNYLAKLDWYATDDHLFSATYIDNETEENFITYNNPGDEVYTGKHGEFNSKYKQENGGDILILNYAGQITDDFSVNVMFGQLENLSNNSVPKNLPGAECPYVIDKRGDKTWSNYEYLGCMDPNQFTVVDLEAGPDRDTRDSWKIDFEYTLDDHTIRAGINKEEWVTHSPGRTFSGGVYYLYETGNAANKGVINRVDVGIGTETVRVRTFASESGSFGVNNSAWYIEDTWQYTDDIMFYAGLRNETFENIAANGDTFVKSDNLLAPRLGFSWDVDGDSTKKLYGTIGRSYIPIAANTNVRATRTEKATYNWYQYTGMDATTAAPTTLGAEIGAGTVDSQIPDPRTIAVKDLDPMHQDEYILGYQQEVMEDWTAGVKFMYREVQDGMDDFCAHDGFVNWAKDNNHDDFDVHSMAGCLIINPGKDLNLFMDLNNDGNVTEVTVPNSYFDNPKYDRSYTGIELTLDKAFTDNWTANFSYTWSESKGNVEGYVNSSLEQVDAGATQDFDHKRFQDGSDGLLPNNRTHVFKAYGVYQVNDELSLSVNMNIASGTPLSALGYIPLDGMIDDGGTTGDYGNFTRYGASSFYTNDGEGNTVLGKRGQEGETPWTWNVDLGISYTPSWADDNLTVQAQIYNLFNNNKATEFNQQKDLTQGSIAVNPNFMAPVNFQTPRYVSLTARYRF